MKATRRVSCRASFPPLRRLIRRAARGGLAAYATTLLASSARAAAAEGSAEAAALPAVWGTMHLSYGIGFLIGCLEFGPPTAGIRWLVETQLAVDRPTVEA